MHTGYNRDLYTIFGPARPGISFGTSFGPARPSPARYQLRHQLLPSPARHQLRPGPAFAWLRPPGRTYSAISPAITSLIV